MPVLPAWLSLVCGAVLFVWGLFRLRVGFRPPPPQPGSRTAGLYSMRRSTHFLMGTIYVILGTMLVLGYFGLSLRSVF